MHFLQSVWTEMKNVSWPNRKDLRQAVQIVLASVILATMFLSGVDYGISQLFSLFL